MAGRIDSTQKERLVAAGLWPAFLQRRLELKNSGYAPDDARATAMREVMRAVRDDDGDDDGDAAGLPALPTAPAALAGRAAAEPEIVRWVARNIDVREPDPASCPDPFAWTLLRQARSSPAFVPFFVEKLWSKLIPARSQLEDAGPKEFDGKPTLELIGRIEAMRDAAMRT